MELCRFMGNSSFFALQILIILFSPNSDLCLLSTVSLSGSVLVLSSCSLVLKFPPSFFLISRSSHLLPVVQCMKLLSFLKIILGNFAVVYSWGLTLKLISYFKIKNIDFQFKRPYVLDSIYAQSHVCYLFFKNGFYNICIAWLGLGVQFSGLCWPHRLSMALLSHAFLALWISCLASLSYNYLFGVSHLRAHKL